MLKNMLILFLLLLSVSVGFAKPASEDPNVNVISLDEILLIEEGSAASSTERSPDGQRLLVIVPDQFLVRIMFTGIIF